MVQPKNAVPPSIGIGWLDWRFLCVRTCLALSIITSIWIPYFSHFRIDRTPVATPTVRASIDSPSLTVLNEISAMSFGAVLTVPDALVLQYAQGIVEGTLLAPQLLDTSYQLRGYPSDFQFGSPKVQLAMASLDLEGLLLAAYEQTGRTIYLEVATKRILEFSVYESSQFQDHGFLWNDHAVAARSGVLIRLWLHLRNRPELSVDSSVAIVSFVQRSAQFLAKPSHFTVRTNHGVMQNLALLQITAAFSELPEAAMWRELAVSRLNLQLPFYVSSEGFVLEHSAGYHALGTDLLAMGLRLIKLNGLTPSSQLVKAVESSRMVLNVLTRPDDTLPLLGNTNSIAASSPWKPGTEKKSRIFPLTGYAIWWEEDPTKDLSQTLVTWAKHDGHGHKHADEGAVLFWSDGVDWITSTGYWPYGAHFEADAYSWSGANAPHQPGEPFAVPRRVQVLSIGGQSGARFIEIERQNENGALFRRQILQMGGAGLLVLDFVSGALHGSETVWTLDAALRLHPALEAQSYISSATARGRRVAINHTSVPSGSAQILRGAVQPFGGWVVVNHKPTPADALHLINVSTQSVNAVLFEVITDASMRALHVAVNTTATADRWVVTLTKPSGTEHIVRDRSVIRLTGRGKPSDFSGVVSMPLNAVPNDNIGRAALVAAYSRAVEAYPPWKDWSFYRMRLTYLAALLAIFVEISCLVMSRRSWAVGYQQVLYAHLGLIATWLAMGLWIHVLYLK